MKSTKTVTRPQTWIPSNGKPIRDADDNLIGLITPSRRFVAQKNETNKPSNKFYLPKSLIQNTLHYAVDWVDFIYTDKTGNRYIFRTTPQKFLDQGRPRNKDVGLSKSDFEYVYGEEEEKFFEGYEVSLEGQTSLTHWN